MQIDKKNFFFTSETYQHSILSLVSSIVTQSPHNLRILAASWGIYSAFSVSWNVHIKGSEKEFIQFIL